MLRSKIWHSMQLVQRFLRDAGVGVCRLRHLSPVIVKNISGKISISPVIIFPVSVIGFSSSRLPDKMNITFVRITIFCPADVEA